MSLKRSSVSRITIKPYTFHISLMHATHLAYLVLLASPQTMQNKGYKLGCYLLCNLHFLVTTSFMIYFTRLSVSQTL
jgi:hypothetical protein